MMKVYHGSNQIIERPKLLAPTHPLDYEAGVYTENEALARLKIKKLFNQYVFKTQEAINTLKFKEYNYV